MLSFCWLLAPFSHPFPVFFDAFNVFPIFFWWFSYDFDGFPMILMVFPCLFSAFSPIWTWVSSPRFRSGRRSGRLRPAARGERRPMHTRLLDLAEDAPSLGGWRKMVVSWWFHGALTMKFLAIQWDLTMKNGGLMGFNQQDMWFPHIFPDTWWFKGDSMVI